MIAQPALAKVKPYAPLLLAGLLSAISLIVLFSLYLAEADGSADFNPWRQAAAVAIGIALATIIGRIDLNYVKRYAGWLYLISLLLLGAVLLIGRTANGATRWLGPDFLIVQPSELAKLAVIILLARLFSAKRTERSPLSTLLRSALYGLLPAGLIVLQPDLGSAVIFVVIWLSLLISSPLPRRLVAASGLLLAGLFLASLPLLADYQRSRIESFLDPMAEPGGAGYNARQSLIAVGSGQLAGRGLDASSQSNLRFLPAEHTDFIFAVVAEKLGFVGAGLSLIALAALALLIFRRAAEISSGFAAYLLIGIGTMFAVGAIVNIAMNLGWLPVTGIPLPFMSYGGSHTLSGFLAIGLVLAAGRKQASLSFSQN